jgi:N-acyl-L-homoserine lactone synthetase
MADECGRLTAYIFKAETNPCFFHEFLQFRKVVFVDNLGWNLNIVKNLERDDFDHASACYSTLYHDSQLIGGFRAIRCDEPYLAAGIFPHLPSHGAYPKTPDSWEISRFGVLPRFARWGPVLYAMMFHFAENRQARALVAVADPGHQRLMRRMGILSKTYGPSVVVGTDVKGNPIHALAGEIPIRLQRQAFLRTMRRLLSNVEIFDETLVFGYSGISARFA